MMVRICGALLILAGSIGISYSFNHDMRCYIALKRELIKMLQLLEGEIRHRNLNLPECFASVPDRLSEPVAGFLTKLTEELRYREGTALSVLWSEKVHAYFSSAAGPTRCILKDGDIEGLCGFGEEFGYRDQTMQINMIQQYEARLEEEVSGTLKQMQETSRIYSTMGVLGGVFVIVVLL